MSTFPTYILHRFLLMSYFLRYVKRYTNFRDMKTCRSLLGKRTRTHLHISYVVPTHGLTSVRRQAKIYNPHLCVDTCCRMVDISKAINHKDNWRERERERERERGDPYYQHDLMMIMIMMIAMLSSAALNGVLVEESMRTLREQRRIKDDIRTIFSSYNI